MHHHDGRRRHEAADAPDDRADRLVGKLPAQLPAVLGAGFERESEAVLAQYNGQTGTLVEWLPAM